MSEKNKKKGNNSKKNNKFYEKIICYVILIIIFILGFSLFKSINFLPAFLISIGLELFCIAYYYVDNKQKKSLVYGLFELGVTFVVIAVIFTIINVVK